MARKRTTGLLLLTPLTLSVIKGGKAAQDCAPVSGLLLLTIGEASTMLVAASRPPCCCSAESGDAGVSGQNAHKKLSNLPVLPLMFQHVQNKDPIRLQCLGEDVNDQRQESTCFVLGFLESFYESPLFLLIQALLPAPLLQCQSLHLTNAPMHEPSQAATGSPAADT